MAKFSKSRVWGRAIEGVALIFQIPALPYNTVYDRWQEAAVLKAARFFQAFLYIPVCDGQKDRHRHRAIAIVPALA